MVSIKSTLYYRTLFEMDFGSYKHVNFAQSFVLVFNN